MSLTLARSERVLNVLTHASGTVIDLSSRMGEWYIGIA